MSARGGGGRHDKDGGYHECKQCGHGEAAGGILLRHGNAPDF
jgi:hypothetical protein